MPNLPLLHLTWRVLIADLGKLWSSMVWAWAVAVKPRPSTNVVVAAAAKAARRWADRDCGLRGGMLRPFTKAA